MTVARPAVQRIGLVEKIYLLTIAAYASFSAIYWLPGVPSQLIDWAKTGLFVGLVLLSMPTFQRGGKAWANIYLALGVCAVAAFVVTIRQDGLATSIERGMDFVEPAGWLLVLNSIRTSALPHFYRLFRLCIAGFVLIAVYPFIARFGIVPDPPVPAEFFESIRNFGSYDYLIGLARASDSGFNAGRTGWAPPVMMAAMCLAAMLLVPGRQALRNALLAVVVVVFGFVATAVLGARGATLATLVVGLSWMLLARGNQTGALWALWGVAIGSLLVDWAALLPERFFRDAAGVGLFDRLDYITTGRLTTYVEGLRNFAEAPIAGVGVEQSFILLLTGELLQIHNTWIRALSEGGLLLAIPLFVLGWMLLKAALAPRLTTGPRSEYGCPNFRPVLLGGLLMSMMEPSVIFGAFNNNALFWTALWFVVGIQSGRLKAEMFAPPPPRLRRFGGHGPVPRPAWAGVQRR